MSPIHRLSARGLLSQLSLTLVALAALVAPSAFAVPGDLYVTDLASGSVIRYEPDGTAHTFASGLVSPQGIAFDKATDTSAAYFYVADAGDGGLASGIVYRYDRAGNRTIFASGLNNPIGVASDGADIVVAENGAARVIRLPIDGSAAIIALVVDNPLGVDASAFDQSGFLTKFIATGDSVLRLDRGQLPINIDSDDVSHSVGVDPVLKDVYVTTAAGTISKVAADGSTNVTFASGFTNPQGLAFVPPGLPETLPGIYVADSGAGEVIRVLPGGQSLLFVSGGDPNFLAFESNSPPDPTPTPTPSPTPTPTPTPAGKPLNISTRVDVETGDNVGIGGFIITGTDPKLVVLRALGPSLAEMGVPGNLSDPILELHDHSGAIIATNDNWKDNTAEDQAYIVDHVLAPTDDLESAIVMSLPAGGYTAVVKGVNDVTGVALIEAYDQDDPSVDGEFANISTRGLVGTDANILIGGVIVGPLGGDDASVVVRAIGPSLANAVPPVPDPLVDPVLEIHNSDGDPIATNDNWATDPSPDNYSEQVKAAGLAPTEDGESAIFVNLIPGGYTATVSGKNGTVGVGLVEVYHVPAQP